MQPVIDPKNIAQWILQKHIGVTSRLLVNGQNMTVVWSRWEPGSSAPEHAHLPEQIGMCLEGQIIITINKQDYLVKAGEYYHIPPNAPHSERNDSNQPAILTDFFSPIRKDMVQQQFDPEIIKK